MFEKLISRENIETAITIAVAIGALGGMFALIAHDQHVNGDRYAEEARIREEHCQAHPEDCQDNFYFPGINW